MWITRKLGDVHHSLALPAEQEEAKEFLANPEIAQRVNSMVEDIFDALMEYQVSVLDYPFPTMSDLCTRLHCSIIFMMRVANS